MAENGNQFVFNGATYEVVPDTIFLSTRASQIAALVYEHYERDVAYAYLAMQFAKFLCLTVVVDGEEPDFMVNIYSSREEILHAWELWGSQSPRLLELWTATNDRVNSTLNDEALKPGTDPND
jgi:hypothetical protein